MLEFDRDTPTGEDLLAEIGLDPQAVREVIEDDRARRCPDRGAVFPDRRIAEFFTPMSGPGGRDE